MTALLQAQGWRFIETPPMNGAANMRKDCENLAAIAQGAPPVFRLFRFSEPTVSYGRLQRAAEAQNVTPKNWALVRRPTAGGIVFHETDLCLSLCWKTGTGPVPHSPKEMYGWIHRIMLRAFLPAPDLHLAACCDAPKASAPFHERQCFQEPVGFDVLSGAEKIAGGALSIGKTACLYQGSIQRVDLKTMPERLRRAFRSALPAC